MRQSSQSLITKTQASACLWQPLLGLRQIRTIAGVRSRPEVTVKFGSFTVLVVRSSMAMSTLVHVRVLSFLVGSFALAFVIISHAEGLPSGTPTVEIDLNGTISVDSSGPYLGNPIDRCWQTETNWESDRRKLADCSLGFGSGALGGKHGSMYLVTNSGNDDPVSPIPGTLRHAVIQNVPLWIIFEGDMTIQLKEELIMNSFKTIDGRGAQVHIANGACITIQDVRNVIIHDIFIHDCKPTGPAMVRSTPEHVGQRGVTDGDGINIFNSRDIWIDHCYLARCTDGLIDAIEGSTALSYTNNYFADHDKTMLLGAHDGDWIDKHMQATIAFNYFGVSLIQRMPRCRNGYFHIANNYYSEWAMYAVGGSAAPTINSEGNYYQASTIKEVTKRIETKGDESWNWRSCGDLFENGAYFVTSGAPEDSPAYNLAKSFTPELASRVPTLTRRAGPLIFK